MKNLITTLLFTLLFASTFAQRTINASDIMRDIKNGKTISITNATIEGVLDFTFMEDALPNLPKRKRWWSNGGSNTIEKQISNLISFTNCKFRDNVLAYIPHKESGYTFIANFEDNVSFKNCVFKRKAMFKYSEFEGDAYFSESKFLDDTTFKYAEFKERSSFKNTLFDEPATFKNADFDQFVSFANAIFKETATFKYTKFNNGVSFNSTKFNEDLIIKYTKVSGNFDITNMEVEYSIDSKYATINGKKFNKYLFKSR